MSDTRIIDCESVYITYGEVLIEDSFIANTEGINTGVYLSTDAKATIVNTTIAETNVGESSTGVNWGRLSAVPLSKP